MTGVLHPIGPEPERTYWIRRVVFLAVLIVLVGGLVAVARTVGGGSSPVATAPGETSPSATPAVSLVTPTPAASPTPTSTPAATPTASSASTPTASPTAKSGEAGSKSGRESSSPAATSSASATSTASAATLCAASQLSSKLSGDRSLKVDQNTSFTVSLTNGGATPCTLAVAASTFELKIYSGTDRIWSTKDCTSEIKPTTAEVKAGQALTWRQDWNGRRSASGCKKDADMPQPGVYWATAQYTGAKPTQLRMIIS